MLGHTPIYIVSLWGNGAGEIDVNNLYLTDNADDMPTAITPIVNANPDFTDVYNLYGIRVRSHVFHRDCHRGASSRHLYCRREESGGEVNQGAVAFPFVRSIMQTRCDKG